MAQDLVHGSSRPIREQSRASDPDRPADGRAGGGHNGSFRPEHEHELPATPTSPDETIPGELGLPAHARGRLEGEREHERGRLAPDDEEALRPYHSFRTRRGELLRGSDDVEYG